MSLLKKIIIFLLVCLLVTEIIFNSTIPLNVVYNNRIKYSVFKDNPDSIATVLTEINQEIKKEKLEKYVIILGDSISFSTPVEENKSIGKLMNDLAKKDGHNIKFFNLAVPSLYPGDVYVMVKLLQKYGISTDNLIVNYNYFEFLFGKDATSIFWFKQYLKHVDQSAYTHVYGKADIAISINNIKESTMHFLQTNLSLLKYKDFVRNYLSSLTIPNYVDFVADVRPWFEKKSLPEDLKKSSYNWYFSDRPIVIDQSRTCVYFIDRLIEHQKGKNTIIFLPGFNRELLSEQTSKPGFEENLKKIDTYFRSKPVTYINYDRQIDYKLYADFLHLTPKGYELLSNDLWSTFKGTIR